MLLLLLRIGSKPSAAQAGFHSLTAFWTGGAGSPPPAAASSGYRGLLGFWVGGITAGLAITPPPPVIIDVGGRQLYKGYAEERKPSKPVKVDSSHVKTVQYDSGNVNVTFKNGSEYVYQGVPEKRFKGLVKAASTGKYLHNNIIGNYSTSKRK